MHDDQVPTFAAPGAKGSNVHVLMYASELDLNIISRPLAEDISRPLAEDISRPLAGGYLSHQATLMYVLHMSCNSS